MKHSLLSAVMASLLGIGALGGLAFLSAAPNPAIPSKSEGGWRLLDPVTYENIAIFPVVTSNTRTQPPSSHSMKASPPEKSSSASREPRVWPAPATASPLPPFTQATPL